MDLSIILTLVLAHWVSDFILQTDDMAKGKSTSTLWLAAHGTTYTASLSFIIVISILLFQDIPDYDSWTLPVYLVLNGVLHTTIDYFTSRLSSKLWADGQVHNFFVVIGFDQMLHMMCLFSTWVWLFS